MRNLCNTEVDEFKQRITVVNPSNHCHLYCNEIMYIICEQCQVLRRDARLQWDLHYWRIHIGVWEGILLGGGENLT